MSESGGGNRRRCEAGRNVSVGRRSSSCWLQLERHTPARAMVSGRARSFGDIAKAEDVTRRCVRALMPLAFLTPDVVAAVLTGAQPIDLTTETLTKRTDLPLRWAEQRTLLGFDSASANASSPRPDLRLVTTATSPKCPYTPRRCRTRAACGARALAIKPPLLSASLFGSLSTRDSHWD